MNNRRRVVLAGVLFLLAFSAGLAIVVWQAGVPLSSEQLRRRLETALSDRLDSAVELEALHVSFRPQFTISGEGLTIRHRRDPSVPLIVVRAFTLTSAFRSLLRNRVDNAVVEGLAITIPRIDRPGDAEDVEALQPKKPRGFGKTLEAAEIGNIVADGAVLTVLSKRPDGHPKVWSMHSLRLHRLRLNKPMTFESVLTNAIPPGEIVTQGSFGPWNAESPGASPVQGTFTFAHADLSVFKGISGILSATGDYDGSIERINVSGETTTPDFMVAVGGHPFRLDTSYDAIVDGTNGDTTLNRVEGRFLKSSFVAAGAIIDTPGVAGRRLTLDVTFPDARLEDVLPIAVDAPRPTMTGALTLKTKLDLPPGNGIDVVERLRLQGEFAIKGGRFTDPGVQTKVRTLSGRARGKPDDQSAVRSDFTGQFLLSNGSLRLSPLRFNVPGAMVQIAGHYGVRRGSLAFAGQVLMDAKVSQAVGGWKSLLIKPFDGLFRKEGRTFIPITISGVRSDPKFGVDRHRIFNKDAPPTLPTTTRAASQLPSKRF